MAHDLVIFNSLGGKLEKFTPIQEGKASIYCCGPTVYSDPHIGNFRPVISFDVLRRLLIKLGYDVKFVSNYTDVDDKIIRRAEELCISEKDLTENVIKEFARLVNEVGSLLPDEMPRPTVYMPQIIDYVNDLIAKGFAYEKGGDVYLRVRKIKNYGILSGNTIDSLDSGARIDVNDKKEDPLDFALWKKTSDNGIKWETKWCNGRPGWHTECCVMINSIFRETNGYIDIHCGGFDLKFPHHENEIAQSVAHNDNNLAKYWMHNGFINVDNEKMSKSLGNVRLMKDVVASYGGMPFRMMILSSHYRAPVSFKEETIAEAKTKYTQLADSYKKVAIKLQLADIDTDALVAKENDKFFDAICDDINTPNALAVLYEANKEMNNLLRQREVNLEALQEAFAKVKEDEWVLGIRMPEIKLTDDDKALYQRYFEAKANKDFALSDELRKALLERGIF